MLSQYESKPSQMSSVHAGLATIREQVLNDVMQRCNTMLDSVDDAFFDQSKNSDSDKEQQFFFQSMREMRIRRKQIELSFRQFIETKFHDAFGRAWNVSVITPEKNSVVELSLVNEDELEEDLAIEGMSNRSYHRHEPMLKQIACRVALALKVASFPAEKLPLHPRVFSEALRDALQHLTLDTKAKLIIYKLFERIVLNDLNDSYGKCNNVLIKTVVAPVSVLQKPNASKPVPAPIKSSTQDNECDFGSFHSTASQAFENLRGLLAQQKALSLALRSGETPPAPVQTTHLLQALALLQKNIIDAESLRREGLIKAELQKSLSLNRADGHSLGYLNDDLIDIVSMLFEFIWGDNDLRDDIKSLLARLQIPMIRVAISDKSFFNNHSHSARALLNEMALAGMGWDPIRRGKDSLHQKVEEIVLRVLNEFDGDLVLFDNLLGDFRSFVENERRRAQLIEQRILQAEAGKTRTDTAKLAIREKLDGILEKRTLSPDMQTVLNTSWFRVLHLEYMQNEGESERYKDLLQTTVWLIRTINPQNGEESAQLSALIPIVVRKVRAALEAMSMEVAEMHFCMQVLEASHLAAIKLARSPRATEGAPAAQLPNASKDNAAVVSTAEINVSVPAPKTAEANLEKSADKRASEDDLLRVDSLPVGNWIQYLNAQNNTVRCKLAAKLPVNGHHIFVNRLGIKVAEFTRNELALALAEGRVLLIDDQPLFDRALETVISNLRQMKAQDGGNTRDNTISVMV